jgi:hypothetical protein
MKNFLFMIWLSVLICALFISNAVASDVVISGSSQFDSSLSDKFMEKRGYVFIEETSYADFLTTNIYGAKGAEVIVEDYNGTVLGTETADDRGDFSITVPEGDIYLLTVKFRGRERTKKIEFPKIDNVTVYIGFFKSETVDSWFIRPVSR